MVFRLIIIIIIIIIIIVVVVVVVSAEVSGVYLAHSCTRETQKLVQKFKPKEAKRCGNKKKTRGINSQIGLELPKIKFDAVVYINMGLEYRIRESIKTLVKS